MPLASAECFVWGNNKKTVCYFTGGVFLEEKRCTGLTEEETKIIKIIRSMKRGELKIIIKNNRPRKLEQIYTFPSDENMQRTKE